MIAIKGNTFKFGKKQKKVNVHSFYMGQYEVTIGEYKAFCDDTKRKMNNTLNNLKQPITNVSYEDAIEYCEWLCRKTGSEYRLPTETEWEYAAKGGELYSYAGSEDASLVAWHYGNSGSETHKVGSKKPNRYNLYDMSGNVEEWCSDWYKEGWIDKWTRPLIGFQRVIKGGSWQDGLKFLNITYRRCLLPTDYSSTLGFRVVMVPKIKIY